MGEIPVTSVKREYGTDTLRDYLNLCPLGFDLPCIPGSSWPLRGLVSASVHLRARSPGMYPSAPSGPAHPPRSLSLTFTCSSSCCSLLHLALSVVVHDHHCCIDFAHSQSEAEDTSVAWRETGEDGKRRMLGSWVCPFHYPPSSIYGGLRLRQALRTQSKQAPKGDCHVPPVGGPC